jgi:hypothetical protein
MNAPNLTSLRRISLLATLCVAGALGAAPAMAGQLVYTPTNPSFGGNAFNGSYLMSIAQQASSQSSPDALAGIDLSSLNDLGKSLDTISSKLDSICSATTSCTTSQ